MGSDIKSISLADKKSIVSVGNFKTKKVVESTKIFNGKLLMSLRYEPLQQRLIITRDDDIIHIKKKKDG